jgi:cation diffusion facilitator family transporter
MEEFSPRDPSEVRQMRFAMRLSLGFGVLMFFSKGAAYYFTGSAAIFSDAAESVVHVIAVAFAAYSLSLSTKPAGKYFLYGYERMNFVSAGFEGAMIAVAAIGIIFTAVEKWLRGLEFAHMGAGTLVVLAAAVVNGALGWYLVSTGRKTKSILLEANGKHVLTDSWTSFGVFGGLLGVLLTGWKPLDPIVAIAVALQILWSGGGLFVRAARGLLDYSDPEQGRALREQLDTVCGELGIRYHGVRYRSTGYRTIIHVHLLFPFGMPVGEAHRLATRVEETVAGRLDFPAEISTHLEALEDHAAVHGRQHNAGKPG